MRKLIPLLILLLSASAFAQRSFEIKDASRYFDIRVTAAKCDGGFCTGPATFSFFKKGSRTPYQLINMPDTLVQLKDDGNPLVNVNLLYDEQSVINVGDFNFDGMEDVALCDGAHGSYGGPSYRVYLSSRSIGKFVFNRPLTGLGQHLGMFTVNKQSKMLETFDKSGCCWHVTDRYKVVNDRPVRVFEEVEDATIPDETKVKITTLSLIRGRWKTSVKYVKRDQ